MGRARGGPQAIATDGFANLLGQRRGRPAALDGLAAIQPSEEAVERVRRLEQEHLRYGDYDEALDQLSAHPDEVERAPLLARLASAVASSSVDESLFAELPSAQALIETMGMAPELLEGAGAEAVKRAASARVREELVRNLHLGRNVAWLRSTAADSFNRALTDAAARRAVAEGESAVRGALGPARYEQARRDYLPRKRRDSGLCALLDEHEWCWLLARNLRHCAGDANQCQSNLLSVLYRRAQDRGWAR